MYICYNPVVLYSYILFLDLLVQFITSVATDDGQWNSFVIVLLPFSKVNRNKWKSFLSMTKESIHHLGRH